MLTLLGQNICSLISFRFIGLLAIFVGREFMCLIEDYHIPTGLRQDVHNILATDEIDTGYNTITILEYSGLRREHTTIHQFEGDIELYAHLVLLPLFCQTSRRDNQYTLHIMTKHQLFEKKASHDGFTCTSIVCKQETNLGLWQQELIDCFHLMRQGVNDTTVNGKEWVKLIGRFDALSLCI